MSCALSFNAVETDYGVEFYFSFQVDKKEEEDERKTAKEKEKKIPKKERKKEKSTLQFEMKDRFISSSVSAPFVCNIQQTARGRLKEDDGEEDWNK